MLAVNQIHNLDVLDGLRQLDNKSIDLIIIDPPYFQIRKEDWDNQWETEHEYYAWCKKWIKESKRVLKENGSLLLNKFTIKSKFYRNIKGILN